MAEQTAPASTQTTAKPTPRRNFAQVLELDTRLLGMIGAFILMCIGFDLFTDGRFLTARNIADAVSAKAGICCGLTAGIPG